jgi:prevent-host-death family protein
MSRAVAARRGRSTVCTCPGRVSRASPRRGRDLAAVVDQARSTHEPVYLNRHGQRVAAVIAADDLERLQALAKQMSDILDAKAARAEVRNAAAEPVPWEQVKADLGLR